MLLVGLDPPTLTVDHACIEVVRHALLCVPEYYTT